MIHQTSSHAGPKVDFADHIEMRQRTGILHLKIMSREKKKGV
jgi:hypothetical protein